MQSPIATVISATPGHATVEVEPAAVCARCASGKGCGAGLLGAGREPVRMDVEVPLDLALAAGERVYLELEPDKFVKATWLAYGLPLFGLLAGTAATWRFAATAGELVTVAGAAVGALAGLLLGRWYLGRQSCLRHFVPRVCDRVTDTRQQAS